MVNAANQANEFSEPVMEENDLELPYPYTENHRAGSTKYIVTCWAVTAALAAAAFLGAPVPFIAILAPVFLMAMRAMLFDVIRNATHEAIRGAQADARLDNFIADGAFYARTHDLSKDDLKQRFHEIAEEAKD